MVGLADPGLIVADGTALERALEPIRRDRLVLSGTGDLPGPISLEELGADPRPEVDVRCTALRRDDVTKILDRHLRQRRHVAASAAVDLAGALTDAAICGGW